MNRIVIDLISYAKDGASKGCLMAMFKGDDASTVSDFSKAHLKDENLAPDGREEEPHTTVLYGFHPDFNAKILNSRLNGYGCLDFTLGSISRFECPEYDVIKIEAKSDSAQQLHYDLRKQFADSLEISHPIYHPHVTLGYVKKGTHKELDGNSTFEGKKVSVSSLVYSYPNKTDRKEISLT